MKVTIHHNGTDIEWDSSMTDDRVELNQIARDLSLEMETAKILRRYVDRNQHMMDFECGVCAANKKQDRIRIKREKLEVEKAQEETEKTNVSPEQTVLFEDEQAPE